VKKHGDSSGGDALVPGKVEGVVAAVSSAGDLITDITADQLRGAPKDMSVTVTCDEHETNGIFAPGHNEPEATFLAMIGDGDRLTLTIVGDSARAMLGINVGERVVVRW
jgi:S-adenosylmethionine hydrolase